MRKLVLVLSLLSVATLVQAKKKNLVKHAVVLQANMREKPAPRSDGRLYEFEIKALHDNLQFDSVWFGATPVPCDVWTSPIRGKATSIKKNSTYLISCNRDLYRYYADRFDSTASSHVLKNTRFEGEAMLLYRYQGKRYTLRVNHILSKQPRPTRK